MARIITAILLLALSACTTMQEYFALDQNNKLQLFSDKLGRLTDSNGTHFTVNNLSASIESGNAIPSSIDVELHPDIDTSGVLEVCTEMSAINGNTHIHYPAGHKGSIHTIFCGQP